MAWIIDVCNWTDKLAITSWHGYGLQNGSLCVVVWWRAGRLHTSVTNNRLTKGELKLFYKENKVNNSPHWCQKQVSQAGISNCIPQYSVGCNYLSLPKIPASGTKVLNYLDNNVDNVKRTIKFYIIFIRLITYIRKCITVLSKYWFIWAIFTFYCDT